jgi:hypothetical protein
VKADFFGGPFLFIYSVLPVDFTSGTRFPRAIREPPQRMFALAGSHLDTLFPQESRALRSNQLRDQNVPFPQKILFFQNRRKIYHEGKLLFGWHKD